MVDADDGIRENKISRAKWDLTRLSLYEHMHENNSVFIAFIGFTYMAS